MNSRESGLGAGDSTERTTRVPSPEPRAPSPLPRQVKVFGWVSLLNDFASDMIYPLLPAFVTGGLGGGGAAGRHGRRGRGAGADPRVVAARVGQRGVAHGHWGERGAGGSGIGPGGLGGKGWGRSGEVRGG